MRKRRFSIWQITKENLGQVSDYFKINQATIARMAIIHGIDKLKDRKVFNAKTKKYEKMIGYRPIEDRRKIVKTKLDISLPDETWQEFDKIMDTVYYRDNDKKNVPYGKMVDLLLQIELRKFVAILDENEMLNEHGLYYSFTVKKRFDVRTEMPMMLYKKIKNRKNKIGVTDTQMGKYIACCGMINEHTHCSHDTLETDADILNEIEILGLDKLKVLTLIRYMIASGRIEWKD